MRRNLLLRFSSLVVLLFLVGATSVSAQSYINPATAEEVLHSEMQLTYEEITNFDQVPSQFFDLPELELKYKVLAYTLRDVQGGTSISEIATDVDSHVDEIIQRTDPNYPYDGGQVQDIKGRLQTLLTGQF